MTDERLPSNTESPERALVIGMGAYAFGREWRAVRGLHSMRRIDPVFLISRWEDGTVSALLDRYGFEYAGAPFGYLGRARLQWTLVTLLHLPILLYKTLAAYRRAGCRTVLILELGAFLNALPAILWLKVARKSRLVFYLGDTPHRRTADRLLGRLVDRTADAVVVNADSVRRGLVAVGVRAELISVVHNGIDLAHYASAKPAGLRRRAGWPGDAVLIGFVGQFTENKGVEDFLDAAALVAHADAACRFVLVGGINELDHFQSKLDALIRRRGLSEKVMVTGWMEDVAPAYADLDLLVVPSRHEDPAPNTTIEAMASGIPIVATRVGGTPELVADGETAFLVDRAAPDQLADGIAALAADASTRNGMGAAGRVRAERLFDAAENAAAVERIILGPAGGRTLDRERGDATRTDAHRQDAGHEPTPVPRSVAALAYHGGGD